MGRWHETCEGRRVLFLARVLAIGCVLAMAQPVYAQCASNASSCVTCHETQGLRPVLQSAQPWHVDHGFGDLCASCHAGEPTAATEQAAHLGLRDPLLDATESCAGCHSGDAPARAERYRALKTALVAPASAPPALRGGGGPSSRGNRWLAAVALVLAGALFKALRPGPPTLRRPLAAWLRGELWSPYVAGALLGLVVAFSEVRGGRPLGASGAFDKLAAYVGRWLFPTSQYYAHLMSPGVTWQVWLMVGVLGGSFASSKLAGKARLRWLPDTEWQARFGASRLLRLGVAFVGAALVQLGAGIAGGCTSGLAISGGAALAPAAFLFMAGMFAGGIPAAWLVYRKRAD
jgi:hypothetical protein